jgi:hypothetical protein
MEEFKKLNDLEQAVLILIAKYENHPNANTLFEAYGLLCLDYYRIYFENHDTITLDEYYNSMIFLNEAYNFVIKRKQL